MRKKLYVLIYLLVILLFTVIQTSFFPQFSFTRTKPDLLLLFVASVGLSRGWREGTLAGLVAGIVAGMVSWNLMGLYMLGYGIAGLLSGSVPERVEPDNFLIPLITGVTCTVCFTFVFILSGVVFDVVHISPVDIYRIAIFLIMNGILSLPVFWFCRRFVIPPGRELDLTDDLPLSPYNLKFNRERR